MKEKHIAMPHGMRDAVKEAVEYLFTNGSGQKAHRLVLTSVNGQDLGGWCKQAVIDRILEAYRLGQQNTEKL